MNHVEAAKQSQEEARDQFQSALEEFSSVVKLDGSDLEDTYIKLDKELQKSKALAEEVISELTKSMMYSKHYFKSGGKN